MYEYRDTALIRMPALPPGVLDGPWPDLAATTPQARRLRHEWMTRAWSVPEVADAVSAASPDLAARLDAILTGERTAGGQEQRAAVSLARYVLRMRHRPTPFGLLAGIAPVRITTSAAGSPPGADRGAAAVAVAGADCAWVADVISGLETVPGLLERLAVRADPTWTIRDGQIVIACRQHPGAGLDAAPQKVSIRATAMAELALRRARTPVAVTALAGELAAARPGASQDAALRLIAGLVGCGALITSLRAPMTVTDALAHLNDQLAAVSATEIPAVAETARALTSIQGMLGRHAVTPVAERRALRAAAARAMGELSAACSRPVTTDLRLSQAADLPAAVAREAAAAAGALARLTPDPQGTGPWRAYHARFLDRYGSGAVVPVAELTDPGTGLGLPAGYRGSTPAAPPREVTSRDEALLALAQQAALNHAAEVSLSRDQLTSLAPGGDAAGPPHLDLCFQLRAPALRAAARGQFTLAVISLTPAAGTMTGRFLRLLEPADQDRITAAYAALPTLHPGAVHAQVSSPPLLARTENVSRAPATWPRVISLAEHPADAGPGLDELAVTADERHMYLVSLRDGQQVEPLMLNAVEAAHFTHPVARFLCELPRARAATIGPFPWGPARCLPFLPRIRHGRSILAPATWRIRAAALPAPEQPWQAWARALDRHRDHLAIPAAVYAGDGDQRLRLDLDQNAHLQLLRASHHPGRPLVLTEAPSTADLGWAAGRDHEITLALALTRPAAPAAASSPARPCPAPLRPGEIPR